MPAESNGASSGRWPERIALALALLRGGVLIVFSMVLVVAPERAVPGSSSEPARSLALMFASRTILLGVAFIVLAIRRRRTGLAWVFFADAALQVFDTAMAIATQKYAVVVLPAAIGAIEVWAGRVLDRNRDTARP